MGKHRVPRNWPELYVADYLKNGNQETACLAAGFAETTARSKCSEKHNDPRVQALLAKAQVVADKEHDISVKTTLEHMAGRAFYDVGDIAGEEIKSPADIAGLPIEVRRAIDGWKYDANGNLELKLANRGTELERVGKHLGMFVERHEVNLNVTDSSTEALKKELAEIQALLGGSTKPDAGSS